MKYSNKILVAFTVVVLIIIGLLAFGSSILNSPFLGNQQLPTGTLLTWLGFTLYPAIFYLLAFGRKKPRSKLQSLIASGYKLLIVLGLLWGLISYGLAGNWSFSFKGQEAYIGSARAGRLFWNFNYILAAAPWILLALNFAGMLFTKKQTK